MYTLALREMEVGWRGLRKKKTNLKKKIKIKTKQKKSQNETVYRLLHGNEGARRYPKRPLA